MGTVSVIIPNYNREALIGETLDNILSQTGKPAEIIVVDDGSTDNSVEVIRRFGGRVILLQQTNKGPAAARNNGLRVAKGEFIQFMDSDDLFSLNKLEVQSKLLAETGSDIAFSPWVKVRLDGDKAIFENHVLQNKMPSSRLPLLSWYLRGWSTVFQTFLVRHSFIKRVGQYREDLMPSEDIELFVRILLNNPRISFTNECLTLYRLHDFSKISGEGTALDKKLIDRGNYLRYTCQNLVEANYETDFYTSLCFQSEIWKLIKELKALPGCPQDIIHFLERRITRTQVPVIKALLFYLRTVVFIRNKLRGSYWRHYYQSGHPSDFQKKLVADLGFSIE